MRSNFSRAVRVTCIVFASAVCVPASAAPAPQRTVSGEVFVKLPAGSTAAQDGKHKDQIEILSWSWGAPTGGSNAMRLEDSAGAPKGMDAGMKQLEAESRMGDPASTGRGVDIARVDGEIVSPGSPAASGLPTGKRQHKPMTITMPLDKGSVILKLASAWPDCRVGKRYAELELGDGAARYKLQDAIITSCAPDGISLNYSKVTVRGWNPEKKED